MDKIVFIELTGYYATSNKISDTLDCEKCLEEAKEKAENLGLPSEHFEEACEEVCGDDLEEVDTSDLKTEKILIRVEDIKNISQNSKGKVIIQSRHSFMPRLYDDTYESVIERVKDYITIV